MKRVIGSILLGIGVFLLVLAPMLKWYVAPKAAVAPLNIDSTTTATGTIIKKLNPSKISQFPNVYDENIPAIQTRYTVGDVQAAEQEEAKSQNLAIYNTFYRVNPASNPGELLLASQARYAFNRNTSQLVNCCGANSNDKTVNFTGVVPLKFPFNPPQSTVQVWDDTLQTTLPYEYVGTKDVLGTPGVEYKNVTPPTQVPGDKPFITLPNKTVGLPGNGNVDLYEFQSYDNTLVVNPTTGQAITGVSKLGTTLRTKGGDKDIVTVSQAEFTGDISQKGADDIAALGDQLNLISKTLPIVSAILGIILIIIGALLLRRKKDLAPATAGGASTGGGTAASAAAAPAAAAGAAGAAAADAKTTVTNTADSAKDAASGAADSAKDAASGAADSAKDAASGAADTAKDAGFKPPESGS